MIDDDLLITRLNFELSEKNLFQKVFHSFLQFYVFIYLLMHQICDGADLQLGLYFFVIIIYLYF